MRKRITTTIDENVLRQLKLFCIENNVNMNDVIEIMWRHYGKELPDLVDFKIHVNLT